MRHTQASLTRLLKLLAVGLLLLLLNSSYLAAFGHPTVFYLLNLMLHFGLGTLLTLLLLIVWAKDRRSLAEGKRIGAGVLLASAALGLTVLLFGATRPFLQPTKPLHLVARAHVVLGVLGVALLALALVRQRAQHRVYARAFGFALVLALLFPLAAWQYQRQTRASRDYILNPTGAPLSMEGEGAGPNSPFWPSSSNTNVNGIIPANFFMTSQTCARCHKDIYDQFNSSAHHFSSFNNQWYRKSIEYMQDVIGTKPSKWCAGCHDHSVFFNGRFDRPIKEQIDTPEAQAGLACTSCHSITKVHSTMGQGHFDIEYPPLHDLAASEQPMLRWTHDALLYLAPRVHRDTFIKPFHRDQTADFCSSCHKVHLDVPVNGYRWFRGFNDYDAWQQSGVSGFGAASFYYPSDEKTGQPAFKKCADCHMPEVPSKDAGNFKGGFVHSHRFPAANTALPFAYHDQQ